MSAFITNNPVENHLKNLCTLHTSLSSDHTNKKWIKINRDGTFSLVEKQSQSTSLPKLVTYVKKILKEIKHHETCSTADGISTEDGPKPYRRVVELLNTKIAKYGRGWNITKIIKRIFIRVIYKKPNQIRDFQEKVDSLQLQIKSLTNQFEQLSSFQLLTTERKKLTLAFSLLQKKAEPVQTQSEIITPTTATEEPTTPDDIPPPPPIDSPAKTLSSHSPIKPSTTTQVTTSLFNQSVGSEVIAVGGSSITSILNARKKLRSTQPNTEKPATDISTATPPSLSPIITTVVKSVVTISAEQAAHIRQFVAGKEPEEAEDPDDEWK